MLQRSDIQLVIFSGIGEDHRASYAQSSLPFKVIRVDYIAPVDGDTLGSYARRFADKLIATGVIDPGKPLFLAGISFGGVIAQEMSSSLRCEGVIMISTYRHKRELARSLRFLGEKVAKTLPLPVYQSFRILSPLAIRSIARIRRFDVMLCARMYGGFPKAWFREHCRMAATWEGCELRVPKLRIHGGADPVVPHFDPRDVDILIPGDMHMSSLSHRDLVNRSILDFIDRVTSDRVSG